MKHWDTEWDWEAQPKGGTRRRLRRRAGATTTRHDTPICKLPLRLPQLVELRLSETRTRALCSIGANGSPVILVLSTRYTVHVLMSSENEFELEVCLSL